MIKTKKINFSFLVSVCLIAICFMVIGGYFMKTFNICSARGGSSEIVIEQSTCRVLKGSNIHCRLPMASTTKIMTAYTALKRCKNIDKVIEIDKKAVGVEGSSIYLKENEKLSIRELLYGLMLRSGNDSAVAIAIGVSGSLKDFVNAMNEEATLLNLKDTHFENPHGLQHPNHYTSAYDLAVITAEAFKNADFKKIVSTERTKIRNYDGNYRYLINKNKMLYRYPNCNGVKTGFTKAAGRCLVASSLKNDMQLISVVLNIGDMYEKCTNLLNYGFNNYAMYSPSDLMNVKSFEVEIENGKKGKIVLPVDGSKKYPLTKSEVKNITYSVDLKEKKEAPLKKGQILGNYKIYLDNIEIINHNIKCYDNIKKKGAFNFFNFKY